MTTGKERPPSPRRVYSALPTVRVGRQAFDRTSRLALAFRLEEQEGGMSALELRFSNFVSLPNGRASFAFEDERVLRLGAPITLYAGDVESPQEIFTGLLTALEAEFSAEPSELVLFAEDALQRARMQRRTRLHPEVSIAEVAAEVARVAGLRPVVEPSLEAKIGPRMQLNESDLAFLRRLLRAYDGDMQVVGEELHVSPRSEVRRDSIPLVVVSQLERVRFTADLAHQVTEVTVAGWDPEQARRVRSVSTGDALGPGRGRTGASLLAQALGGPRSEHAGHFGVLSEAEARARADALFDQRARRFVLAEGTGEGNPSLRVGAHVAIDGASPRFDNIYYVTKVCHRYDVRQGYRTDFEAECAFLGEPS